MNIERAKKIDEIGKMISGAKHKILQIFPMDGPVFIDIRTNGSCTWEQEIERARLFLSGYEEGQNSLTGSGRGNEVGH